MCSLTAFLGLGECVLLLSARHTRSADAQLSAVLEKEGGRRKEGGREGGMRKEDCQFIQRKGSEGKKE